METNFFGTTFLTQAILPKMIAAKGGTIITVTSIGGIMSFPFYGYYHAAKHALEGMFESLWFETYDTGVRIKMVEPGFTRTDFVNRSQRIGSIPVPYVEKSLTALSERLKKSETGSTPDVIARVIVRAMDDHSHTLRYTGGYLSKLLLLRKILPEKLFRWIIRSAI